jgi:cytochrome c-type biogenesis protein
MANRRVADMVDESGAPRPARRIPVGALVAMGTGVVAVLAALLTGSGSGGVSGGVESVAFASAAVLDRVASTLPLGYAFGAGMVAAVNPCGFAMLPAYLALFLGAGDVGARPQPAARLLRALHVSVLITGGFVLLFGLAGLGLSVASSAIARYFPWLGLAVGVLLLWTAGRMLSGGAVYTSIGERVADRMGATARVADSRGFFAYGLAYGLASLSCTLPIFLAVVASTLTSSGVVMAMTQFVLYGLGMGAVLTVLTLSVAFIKMAAIRRVQQTVRHVQTASSILMLLAGAYIIFYWLTLGGLLDYIGLGYT